MGLLKHIILPMFVLIHLYAGLLSISPVRWHLLSRLSIIDTTTTTTNAYDMVPQEEHLIGMIGAFHLALAVNGLLSIFLENSHYRGMACFVDFIYLVLHAYDAYLTSYPYKHLATLAAIAGVGLMIHSQEPGVFTADKSKPKDE
jgi:hypothetical protein